MIVMDVVQKDSEVVVPECLNRVRRSLDMIPVGGRGGEVVGHNSSGVGEDHE